MGQISVKTYALKGSDLGGNQHALAYHDGSGCYLSLHFAPADDYPQDLDVSAVSGDVTVAADEPLLEKLDTRVSFVSISYPGEDE